MPFLWTRSSDNAIAGALTALVDGVILGQVGCLEESEREEIPVFVRAAAGSSGLHTPSGEQTADHPVAVPR
jgi:hypothetical protein